VTVLSKLAIMRRLIAHPSAMCTVGALVYRDGPDSAELPWWNARATRYLSRHLRPGDRVFEWGSGASTVWLTQRGADVTSVEHDPDWMTKVLARCPAANVRSVPGTPRGRLRSEPPTGDSVHYFDDYVAAIDAVADGSLDVVIVDGMSRLACVRRAVPKVRPGGLLVVDDTDMSCFAPVKKQLPGWRMVSHTGFKPTLELRETTFFHKPARP
jgi:Methyltransferase domain